MWNGIGEEETYIVKFELEIQISICNWRYQCIITDNDNDESNNIALFAKRAWKQSYLNSNDPMFQN